VASAGAATAHAAPRIGALDAIFYGLLPLVTFIALARLHISAGVGVGIG